MGYFNANQNAWNGNASRWGIRSRPLSRNSHWLKWSQSRGHGKPLYLLPILATCLIPGCGTLQDPGWVCRKAWNPPHQKHEANRWGLTSFSLFWTVLLLLSKGLQTMNLAAGTASVRPSPATSIRPLISAKNASSFQKVRRLSFPHFRALRSFPAGNTPLRPSKRLPDSKDGASCPSYCGLEFANKRWFNRGKRGPDFCLTRLVQLTRFTDMQLTAFFCYLG